MLRSGARAELPFLVLLLTAVASELALAWEPFNLTATVIDLDDGFNSLEVSWNPGECGRFDDAEIIVIGDNVVKNQTVKTARGLATFDYCEYWSRYEVILRSGLACLNTELHIFIETGPGQPHRPKEFKVNAHESSANFTIVEAFMPREISAYNLQLCQTYTNVTDGCRAETFLNHTATDGFQHGAFADLEPDSVYSYKVIPIIIDGSKNYSGYPLTGSFRTTQIDFPMVVNLAAKYEEKNLTLSGMFIWEVSRPDFPVKRYLITVEPCKTDCKRITYAPAANFTGLEFFSNIRLEVSADFVVGGEIRTKSFAFNLATPNYVAPIEALEIARISPKEVIFRWPPTERPSEYEIGICDAKECVRRRQEIPEVHLVTRKPGALYDVEITVRQESFIAEYFKGPLQMLEKDYEAPEVLSTEVEEGRWNSVVYAIHTLIPEDASLLEVEACSLGRTRRDCAHDKVKNAGRDRGAIARLSLDYFTAYDFVATAVYKLPLGKEVRKTVNHTMRTVGADPGAVENIVAADIGSDSIVLQWEPPKNIPDPVQGILTISYEISAESRNWTAAEPTKRISNLSPYTEYVFSIRAVVTYIKEKLEGKVAQASFKTDAGRAEKVQNLRIHQRLHSPTVNVTWEPPADTHGEVQYYQLDFGSFAPNATERRIPVYSTQTTVTLPVTEKDTLYFFRAAAVTQSSKGDELVGEMTQLNVTVPGIGVTFNVSPIGRTSNSLQLLLESSEDGKRPRRLFYTITDYKNKTIKSTLKLVNVTNLRTYHEEVLRIHACFEEDFCTGEKIFKALTDVDAPSAVIDLKAVLSNRTNVVVDFKEPETKNGPIDGFILEIVDETDAAVRMNFTTKTTHFVFNSSDEYETFRIGVTAFNNPVSDTNKKVFGPTKTVRIRTSGFSVPKVENLRITTAGAWEVTVKWDKAKLDARANETFYKVGISDSKRPELTTQDLSAVISGMTPFKDFSVGVKTCIGDPSALSSCSLPRRTYGKTDSAAPSEPRNLTVRVLGDVSTILFWEPPELSNGKIAGYILAIKNSTGTVTHNITGHHFKAENLNPSETYRVTLVAYVFDRNHRRLESKSATAQFSTGHSSPVVIGLLIFIAVVLTLGVIFGVVWWSRGRRAVPYGQIGEDP